MTSTTRMLHPRHILMTALAFTVGMLLGLCLNLPGVSSPLSGDDSAAVHGRRSPRHIRVARDDEPVAAAYSGRLTLRRRPVPTANDARTYISKGALEDNKARRLKNITDPYLIPSSIRAKVKAIADTYDSINALKEQQVNGKGSDINLGTESEPTQTKQQAGRDIRHPTSVDSQRHTKDRGLSQFGGGRSTTDTDDTNGQRDMVGEIEVGRVFGHRSVTVQVGGRPVDRRSHERYGNEPSSQASLGHGNDGLAENSGQYENLEEKRRLHQSRAKTEFTQEHFHHLSDLVDGVFWTSKMETFIPPGFTKDEADSWRKKVTENKVVGMTEGCGRMQNRKLVLLDASPACARYRINTDQMQGEVYSYYLARILGIRNIPPAVLASASPATDPRWTEVDRPVVLAQWSPAKPVIITPWLDHLRPVFIPRELRSPADRDDTGNINVHTNLHPTNPNLLRNRTLQDLRELVQWSDLIIFDYLTANVDRVVNNMFNQQWNSEMMQSPTHNLERTNKEGLLVFLDNESGLFHSYRLLDKYSQYHEKLLRSLCVFRRQTVEILKRLHQQGSIAAELMKTYREEEPLHWMLPGLPSNNVKVLEERLGKVVEQISRCQSRYSQ